MVQPAPAATIAIRVWLLLHSNLCGDVMPMRRNWDSIWRAISRLLEKRRKGRVVRPSTMSESC